MRHKISSIRGCALLIAASLLFTTGCVKQSEYHKDKDGTQERFDLKPFEKTLLEKEKTIEETKEQEKEAKKKAQIITKNKKGTELDFLVENITGRTIYVVCFSYIKKRPLTRWRWDKSKVYKLEQRQSVKIDIDTILDKRNRKSVYGYLAVFDDEQKAENSIYELLDDKDKIDLDRIYKLKDQKVLVGVEKYGFKGAILDFDFVPKDDSVAKYQELDFVVENKTNKTIFVTCFTYQIKDDMPAWRYDKTPLKRLEPDELGIIDVDTISNKYDRVYMRGYLAIFDEDEGEKAKKITYELLQPKNKIAIGRLAALKNKKIVIGIEKYGELGDFIDFSVKPFKRIDFEKAFKIK